MFITAVLGLFFNLIQMSILDSVDPPEENEKNETNQVSQSQQVNTKASIKPKIEKA